MGSLRPLKHKLNTKQPCKIKIFEKYAAARAKLLLTTYDIVGGRWFRGNSKGKKKVVSDTVAVTLSSTFNSNFPHLSMCLALRESTSQTRALIRAVLRKPQFRGCPREGSTGTGNAQPLPVPGMPEGWTPQKGFCRSPIAAHHAPTVTFLASEGHETLIK